MSELGAYENKPNPRRTGGFLVFIALILYCIAGAALFYFIPDTAAWLRSDDRRTVSAQVISAKEEYFGDSTKIEDRSYRVTLQYVIDGTVHQHTKYAKRTPSGSVQLHVYCLPDGRYEVMEMNIAGILLLTGIAVGAVIFGTRLMLRARKIRQKEG